MCKRGSLSISDSVMGEYYSIIPRYVLFRCLSMTINTANTINIVDDGDTFASVNFYSKSGIWDPDLNQH